MAAYIPKMELRDYADLLDLPHHVSRRHPQMDRAARAAQFNAYQALNGYGDLVQETGRTTDARIIPDEYEQEVLDTRLSLIVRRIREQPEITITYFEQDEVKEGGRYTSVTGHARRLDPVRRTLILTEGLTIPVQEILKLEGDLFDE